MNCAYLIKPTWKAIPKNIIVCLNIDIFGVLYPEQGYGMDYYIYIALI